MKLLIIISLLALSVYSIEASGFSGKICEWSDAVKAAIGKLTPSGQQAVGKLFKINQGAWIAFIGSEHFEKDFLTSELKNEIEKVKTAETAQTDKLEDLFKSLIGGVDPVILF